MTSPAAEGGTGAPSSPVTIGLVAGVAGGATLGGLRSATHGIRSWTSGHAGASIPTVGDLGEVFARDLLTGVALGALAGLLMLPIPPPHRPLARLRRFVEGGSAPEARMAALLVALVAFFHGSLRLGLFFAGRFKNDTLAALLLVALEVSLLLPALAAGRLTERLLVPRAPSWGAAVVFVAAASVGAAIAPHMSLRDLVVVPAFLFVGAVAWAATRVGQPSG